MTSMKQRIKLAEVQQELIEIDNAIENAPDLDTYDILIERRGELLTKKQQIRNGKGYGRIAA